jgi:hypothetical protein
MTEKDIVRLAEEAGLWLHTDRKYEAVEKFAKLVAAEEREACAKVAELFEPDEKLDYIEYASTVIRAIGLEKLNKEAEQNGEQL